MTNDATPDLQALWDYDDPAGSEARFRAMLAEAERADDRDHHAQVLTQIARAQGLQRRFDDAHATLDAAQAMLGPDTARARVRVLLERGRALNSDAPRRSSAPPLFLEAWEHATAHGFDGLAVDAAHMLGIVRPPDEARTWNARALALAESSDDPDARRWTGSLHNNIGWSHHAAGAFDVALTHFERALAAREAAGTPAAVRVARWCVARCLRSLGRTGEALAIQRALEPDAGDDGFVPEEIAECLLALGRPDDARPYFRRAAAALAGDAWLAEAEPERIVRLRRLGAGRDGTG